MLSAKFTALRLRGYDNREKIYPYGQKKIFAESPKQGKIAILKSLF